MKKFVSLSLYILDLVKAKVRQDFLNFKNHLSISHEFLCGVALDVKWDRLICMNLLLHSRKICIQAAVAYVFSVRH
jgi:hypothetical protein